MLGRAPSAKFTINGRNHSQDYFFSDGIYSDWSVFIKTICHPVTAKHKLFASYQEAFRKDIERSFGVLQARFQIIDKPCKLWHTDAMKDVIISCIIMQNMVVEDERDNYQLNNRYLHEDITRHQIKLSTAQVEPFTVSQLRHRLQNIVDNEKHQKLIYDLIEHLWNENGDKF